ncbi:MAG: 30S ribosome-binding factor RbfA [Candidatus Omnitrophica bacterium]|nr:30S ribosome-binding factor RbfA [Candidatus Omnitrophota bacterium]
MGMRLDKVNAEIKRRVMEIIQQELDDPHLGMVSVTRVDTCADLKTSRVYFSVLNNDDFERTGKILASMSGFIRRLLGKKMRIKILPTLVFLPDTSIQYSVDIYAKIEEVMGDQEDNRDSQKQ